MFVMRRLQKLSRGKGATMYMCFIDLTKAYDLVIVCWDRFSSTSFPL